MRLAWIGLGAMGRPMAANLAQHFDTMVWNRTAPVAVDHARDHGSRAVELDEAVTADVVFSCLPTTAEVAAVVHRVAASLSAGTTWVDCTSGDPVASEELAAQLAGRGVDYVDAPVSGGTDGAAAGTLTVMVGGDPQVLERIRPALDPVAARVVHVGPVGAGHATKAINNTLMAAHLWLAGEGLSALAARGVDPVAALEVINHSSGRSFPTERLIPERVLTREFPPTFALGLLAKDAGIGATVVDAAATPAPAIRQVVELVRLAANEVGPDADFCELIRLIERWAGRELR